MSAVSYQIIDGGAVPIKAWTAHVPVDEKAKDQLRQTASLPIVGPHLAVMPDVHWGMGSTVGSVVPTEGALIPACVGVDIGCFVGDTRVPLLDGSQRQMVELSTRTEAFWVYSLDEQFGVVPGLAVCVKTRSNASLVRVTVSGGDEIVCTPDHEFMLWDGSYRRADGLAFNTSLMPLYRRWATRDGYESVSAGHNKSWLAHVRSWEATNGPVPDGMLVHHKNHNHFDNRPDNLELMTASQHSAHHRAMGHRFDNADPMLQRRRREGIARGNARPGRAEIMSAVGSANIAKYMADRPEHFSQAVAGNGRRGVPYLTSFNTSPRSCGQCEYVANNPADLTWHERRDHGRVDGRSGGSNHKVISVETLARTEDVYCLQVEKHHNFAIAAGVFVHNCGMSAVGTSLTSHDLGDNGQAIFEAISKAVPHGRTDDGGPADRGAWRDVPSGVALVWRSLLAPSFFRYVAGPRNPMDRVVRQLGTLGSGNHFVEVCLDEEDRVWVMLHSGSRGIGNSIAQKHIAVAKRRAEQDGIQLPNRDLAWLPEGTPEFAAYVDALSWAQDYARINRSIMLDASLSAMRDVTGLFATDTYAVSCHHNYVSRETHFGRDLWITRKGAVSARAGEMGIIPGSMGTRSFIVRGLGNAESFHSCSHGAGRVMARGEAKRTITAKQHAEDTAGVVCRKDAEVIDESPRAYKRIEDVMASQADLVEIVATLKQVVCVKG